MGGDEAQTETKLLVPCSMMLVLSQKLLRLQKEQVDVKFSFVVQQLPSAAFQLNVFRQKYEQSLKIARRSIKIIYGTSQSQMSASPLPCHLFICSVFLLRAKC